MNELQNTLNKINHQLSDDIVSGLEHRIKFQEKLLTQAIAFREECVAKGLIELISSQDKKIENLRYILSSLREQLVQAIEADSFDEKMDILLDSM